AVELWPQSASSTTPKISSNTEASNGSPPMNGTSEWRRFEPETWGRVSRISSEIREIEQKPTSRADATVALRVSLNKRKSTAMSKTTVQMIGDSPTASVSVAEK